MITNIPTYVSPARILLATDLTNRSDRALDRATQLARQWNAELLVVHAVEDVDASSFDPRDTYPSWRRSAGRDLKIEKRIRADLRGDVKNLRILVEYGRAVQVILDVVEREQCDLVIIGMESDESLQRMFYEGKVRELVRKSPVSVLVVKGRPAGAYRHLLVGTDFTPESRYGLEVAAASFPQSRITLMHAFEMPYLGLGTDAPLGENFYATERAAIQDFIRDSDIPDQARRNIRPVVEHGAPGLMLRRYVEDHEADLTVIGAFGRGFLFHLLVRGETPHIVDAVPSDVLLVRAPRPANAACREQNAISAALPVPSRTRTRADRRFARV